MHDGRLHLHARLPNNMPSTAKAAMISQTASRALETEPLSAPRYCSNVAGLCWLGRAVSSVRLHLFPSH